MKRYGKRSRSEDYIVAEVLEVHRDGPSELLGFNILGPDSDPARLYSTDEVPPKIEKLMAKRRSTPGKRRSTRS